ncbi:MAG: ABC-type transport auxiliary lipoprotein family protein [bacterium]
MIPALRTPLTLMALAMLAGCTLLSGPQGEPTRFYVLTAPPAAPGMSPLRLGLGPVHFPGYLDRPQMARRVDDNRVAYVESARWAEPLKDNFEHVLAANLGGLLGTDRVIRFPWYRTAPIDYAVTVEVSRFERQPGDDVALIARWTLRDGKSGDPLAADLADLHRPASTPDQTAAALSAVTAELAQQIADAVAKLPRR